MEKKNITLGLPETVLRRLEALAAEQGTSISAIVEAPLQNQLAPNERNGTASQGPSMLLVKGIEQDVEPPNGAFAAPPHGKPPSQKA
jgi:hypothetical protein